VPDRKVRYRNFWVDVDLGHELQCPYRPLVAQVAEPASVALPAEHGGVALLAAWPLAARVIVILVEPVLRIRAMADCTTAAL
jgi:hypothetical protein